MTSIESLRTIRYNYYLLCLVYVVGSQRGGWYTVSEARALALVFPACLGKEKKTSHSHEQMENLLGLI